MPPLFVAPPLHRIAQPVSVLEFRDALRAAAPPRIPQGRARRPRRVGLAISGGVDSMALAWLCAALRREDARVRVGDAACSGFRALVIDHGLRAGSGEEARRVAEAVAQLGHQAQVWQLRWPNKTEEQGKGAVETLARRLRYRRLGERLAVSGLFSLLVAHHEDDQYETVLMRLLSGYGLHGGIRGLRGMRAATDIPECRGLYGVHQSGFLDDQREAHPYVEMQPSGRERRRIKAALRADMEGQVEMGGPESFWSAGEGVAPVLPPLDVEDLGIAVYRPLLPFAKDRLVATCEAHGVPWFEDPTNADPTLTLRNALRHLVRRHSLPQALQKPAVLRLAARCHARAAAHEAEARRLLVRHRALVRFTTNTGTAVVRLPQLSRHFRRPRRPPASPAGVWYAAATRAQRRAHLRAVAAVAIQRLLALVTPEARPTPVSQLPSVVDALFPDLATHNPPKRLAFAVGSVYFVPLAATSTWHLARAPYPSPARSGGRDTTPVVRFPCLHIARRWDRPPAAWGWGAWTRWNLYDGRFWVRTRTRLPVSVVLQPFARAHAQPFRAALAAADALALARTLKACAPGKARYTLPALYAVGDIGWALQGTPYWTPEAEALQARAKAGETVDDKAVYALHCWERARRQDDQRLRLVALPTLGVHVPGIEHWLQWEVRYRKVDVLADDDVV